MKPFGSPVVGPSFEFLELRCLLSADGGALTNFHVYFDPDTPPEVYEPVLDSEPLSEFDAYQFADNNRWSTTSSGGGLTQGAPTILTWSIVPDGTSIYGYNGEATSGSQIFSWLGGIYGTAGNPAVASDQPWFHFFQEMFDRWDTLTGIDYVYEPNDDGSAWTSDDIAAGQAGVRGDIRISAHPIDGNSGVLAYNFFPDYGDMVLDANDSFYNNTASDSLRLRNVLAHEHGHGMGLSHVDPVNQTKLMEPFASTAFDGPQFDDILAANRGYGDNLEEGSGNNTAATAVSLGNLTNASVTRGNILNASNQLIMTGEALSIDDDSDFDYFKFTINSAQNVTITLSPEGYTYLSGPQNGVTSNFNAKAQSDLTLRLYNTNGTSILVTANATGAGSNEVIQTTLNTAGTYFIRISGSANTVQMYQLDVVSANVAANTPPDAVDDTGSTDEDTLLTVAAPGVLTNDTDADLDPLTVTAYDAVSAKGAAVVVNANGSYTYDPRNAATLQALNTGQNTTDTFTYTISDGNGGTDTATVTITVGGVNEPTGGATLPYSEDFTDGVADHLIAAVGSWQVNAGRYASTATLNGDTVSVLNVDGSLPSSVDIGTLINVGTQPSGFYANAVIIFDYVSPTNFKFAGAYIGADQVRIGHRDATGWITDTTATYDFSFGVDATLGLTITSGGAATLKVGGATLTSYNFGQDLVDGQVGVGTQNSNAKFDNLTVAQTSAPPPPTGGTTLPYSEDFSDGVADYLTGAVGTWQVTGGRYASTATLNGDTVVLLNVDGSLPSSVDIGTLINVGTQPTGFYANAVIIFDYVSPTNFKFAGGFIGADQVHIGHRDATGWITDTTATYDFSFGVDATMALTITSGGTATLRVGGATVTSHNFAQNLVDGQVGVGTQNSNASFDNVTVAATGTILAPSQALTTASTARASLAALDAYETTTQPRKAAFIPPASYDRLTRIIDAVLHDRQNAIDAIAWAAAI